jgi:CRISPR-associated endonuclease Cas1
MGTGGVALPSWHRIVFDLRNIRNVLAREHPQFVFHAIAKYATRHSGVETPWLLYPLDEALPDRIHLHKVHRLAWVLPSATPEQAALLADSLRRWLADPAHNFELIGPPRIEPRSLRILCDEAPPGADSLPELALDVLTPLVCPGTIRQGRMTAPDLGALCIARLARITPWFTPPAESAWSPLRLLSWFWSLSPKFNHLSKSQPGRGVEQWLQGHRGPLFLRGDVAAVLPALLLASEFTLGKRLNVGEGRFVLRTHRPVVDALLAQPSLLAECWESLKNTSDLDLDLLGDAMVPVAQLAAQTADSLRDPAFTFEPATRFTTPKPDGGQRILHQLSPRDVWIQKSVHKALGPFVDRTLRPEVIGYRPDHSTRDARPLIEAAVRNGFTHVLESDISRFFDTVDWSRLRQVIHDFLPLSDTLTRRLLEAAVGQETRLRNGQAALRSAGLLQGSPLSPLLANLFLTSVDQGLADAGLAFVRFADDILILSPDADAAVRAQETLASLLTPLGLSLNPAKCRISPLDLGIEYLGQHFDADLTIERILATRVRHPLWIRRPYAFLGLDGDVLLVRQDQHITDRIPLHRVSELILVNAGAIGIHLLHRCRDLGLPVIFCDASGRFESLLDAANRSRLDTAGRHHARHSGLSPEARLHIARSLVTAKLENYLRWFHHVGTQPCRDAVQSLHQALDRLPTAADIPSLRGFEGFAAHETFPALRQLLRQPDFATTTRQPGRKPDPFNALLDFGYTQLFVRIETLLHARGLNPWLGILHDEANNYPSLVCDLQEPFRARVDRWAVKTINRREVTLEHFEPTETRDGTTWKVNRKGWPILIESFAREELLGLAHETHAWIDQLAAQVRVVQDWAVTGTPWASYTSPTRPPSAPPEPTDPDDSDGESENPDGEDDPANPSEPTPSADDTPDPTP